MLYRFHKSDDVEAERLTVSVVNTTVNFGPGEDEVKVFETRNRDVADSLRTTGVLTEEVVEEDQVVEDNVVAETDSAAVTVEQAKDNEWESRMAEAEAYEKAHLKEENL